MNEQVFISYSSEDMAWAAAIKENLDSNGISCWMANSGGIAPGENYVEEIMRALDACHVFLLVLSEHAENSPWVSKELGIAISQRKRVIPVKISNYTIDKFRFQLENIQIFQPGNLGEVAEQLKLVNAVKRALDLREVSTDAFVPGHRVPPAVSAQKKSANKLVVPIIAGIAVVAVLVGGIFLGKGLFSGKDNGDGRTPAADQGDEEPDDDKGGKEPSDTKDGEKEPEVDSEAEKALAAAIEVQQNDPRLHYDGDPRELGTISLDGSLQTRSFTIKEEGTYFIDISLSPLTYGRIFKFSADFLSFDESDLPEEFFDGDSTPWHFATVVTLKPGEYKFETNALRSIYVVRKLGSLSDPLVCGHVYYKVFDKETDYTFQMSDSTAGDVYAYSCQKGELATMLKPEINGQDYTYKASAGIFVIDLGGVQKAAEIEKALDAAIEAEQADPRLHTDRDPKTLGIISRDGTDQNFSFTVTERGTYLVEMYLSPLTYGGDFKFESNFLSFNETNLPKEFFDGKTSQYFCAVVSLDPGKYVITTNSLRCRPLINKIEQPTGDYVYGNIYWLNPGKASRFILSLADGTSGTFFAYTGYLGTLLSPVPYKVEDQKFICENVPAQHFVLDLRNVYIDEKALDIEKDLDAAIAVEQSDPRIYYDGDPKTVGTISRDGSMQSFTFSVFQKGVYYVEMYLSPLTYGSEFKFESDFLSFDETDLPKEFFDGKASQYFCAVANLDPGEYAITTNSLRCLVQYKLAQYGNDNFQAGNIYWMNFEQADDFSYSFPEGTQGTFYTYSGYAGALLTRVSAEVSGTSFSCKNVPKGPFVLDLRNIKLP